MNRRILVPILFVGLATTATAQQRPSATPSRPVVTKPLPTTPVPPPPSSASLLVGGSDNCTTADAISGNGTFAVDNTAATTGSPIGSCGAMQRDVWFRWTAGASGVASVSTCAGVSADPVVAVWADSGAGVCPTTQIACLDDSCGLMQTLNFTVTSGTAYYIEYGSFSSSAGYSGTFTINVSPPPANDECTSPTVIVGTGTFPFDNTAASTSAQGQGEGLCLAFGSTAINNDVWFSWTAPASGLLTFQTCGLTSVDTKIAAYPGSACPTGGTALGCNDDNCASLQSLAEFNVTSGSTYLLQIGLYPFTTAGGAGNFSLNITPPPGPPVPASVNVDIGANVAFPVPSSTYAAAGIAGFWNARSATQGYSVLTGTNGSPAEITLTRTSVVIADFDFDNASTTGDDQALMDDIQDVGSPPGGTTTWTFGNLFGGNYTVYTYAWAPDSATFTSTVSVTGSPDPAQVVGGAWPGSQQLGVTYARHSVLGVASGGSIDVRIDSTSGFGSLGGFQLVREGGGSITTYCYGDGTGAACPCGNNGAAGNGCANSVNAAGANLSASGATSVAGDTVVLTGSGMPNATCLYFQGTTQTSVMFGDGLRCAGGTIIRLHIENNVGGTSQYPNPAHGDPSVSVRGQVPAGGGTRTYQCWYRNSAAFCTAATFNLTNGVEIQWSP